MLSDLIKNVKRTQQATLRSMIEMEILKGNIIAFEIHETFELVNGSHRNVVHDMVIKKTRTFQIWLDETMTRFASRQSRYYRPTAQMVSVGLADERIALQHTQDAIRRRRRSLPDNLQQAPHSEQEHLLEESGLQKGGRPPVAINTPTTPPGSRAARVMNSGGEKRASRPPQPRQDTPIITSDTHRPSSSGATRDIEADSTQKPDMGREQQLSTPIMPGQSEPSALIATQTPLSEDEPANTEETTPDVQNGGAEAGSVSDQTGAETAGTELILTAMEEPQPELPVSEQADPFSEVQVPDRTVDRQPAGQTALSIPTEQGDMLDQETLETPSPEEASQRRSDLNRSLLELASDEEDSFELFNPEEQEVQETTSASQASNAASAPRTLDDLDADQNLFAWSDQ